MKLHAICICRISGFYGASNRDYQMIWLYLHFAILILIIRPISSSFGPLCEKVTE